MTVGNDTIGLADEAEFAGSLVDVLEDAAPGPTAGGERSREAPHNRPPERPWVGRTLGRFKLLGLLGEGTMGLVIRALDVNLGRIVALKVLRRRIEGMDESQRVAQFLREARAASQIEHPCVTAIYEIGEHRGWWYIASELVEGGSLHALVKSAGPLPIGRACALLADAASAIAEAHRLGIVHRDIKPQNLLLARSGRCKVVDFGLVRLNDPNDPFDFTTRVVGTPLYIAPEVLRRHEGRGPSDVYGLGGTLHFALTGSPPFVAATAKEVARKHVDGERPDVRLRRPECSARLAEIVRRAMAIDPAERPTAEELEATLRIETIGETDLGTSLSSAGLGRSALAVDPLPAARADGEPGVGAAPVVVRAEASASVPAAGPDQRTAIREAPPTWHATRRRAVAILVAVAALAIVGALLRGWGDGALRGASTRGDESVRGQTTAADREAFAARFPKAPQGYAGQSGARRLSDSSTPRWSWVGRVDPGSARFVANRHGRRAFPIASPAAALLPADSVVFFDDEESVRSAGRSVVSGE